MRITENFEIEVDGKKYDVTHEGIKSYKEQNDFIKTLTDEIKRTSVPHKNIFGQPMEAKTEGFIPYNNFECSVKFKIKMTESEHFMQLHDKFKLLLDLKDFKSVNDLMKLYNNDISSVGELKSILVITKSFKENEVIGDTRKEIVKLLEAKLGQPLV